MEAKNENTTKKTESKGSNLVQLRLSDKQKDMVQKKADEVGMPVTQYFLYLMTRDFKEIHSNLL